MTELSDELKKEHTAMVAILDEVWKLGLGSSESRNVLVAARETFVNHLEKEERELYPPLRKAAETNSNVRELVDALARDIEEISHSALAFFDKYTGGGPSNEFKGDFSALYARLTIRIQQEEDMLFPTYEQLKQ
ncbi:MAG TPA: hemerythrin domain-containing protein [Dissulfurispiraceae bacterium]